MNTSPKQSRTDDEQKKAEEFFREHKAEIERRQRSNAEAFDKAILTYASGALALSLGFLKDFVPLAKATDAYLLYGSWGLFTLCIVATVSSFLVAQPAMQRQLDLAQLYYIHAEESAFTARNDFARWVDRLNIASGTLFCLAILLTTLFIGINAEGASSMSIISNDKSKDAGHGLTNKLDMPSDAVKAAGVPTMTRLPGKIVIPPIAQSDQQGQEPAPDQSGSTGGESSDSGKKD